MLVLSASKLNVIIECKKGNHPMFVSIAMTNLYSSISFYLIDKLLISESHLIDT